MNRSVKFKDLNRHKLVIAEKIYNNQNILRYMNYMTDDPLAKRTVNRQGKIVEQPDLNISFDDAHLYTRAFDENILSTSHCSLFIHALEGNLSARQSIGYITYEIDIVCPCEFQILEGTRENRDGDIADEICGDIDGHMVTGVGDVEILTFKEGKLEKDYTYLALFVRVKNFTVQDVKIP